MSKDNFLRTRCNILDFQMLEEKCAEYIRMKEAEQETIEQPGIEDDYDDFDI